MNFKLNKIINNIYNNIYLNIFNNLDYLNSQTTLFKFNNKQINQLAQTAVQVKIMKENEGQGYNIENFSGRLTDVKTEIVTQILDRQSKRNMIYNKINDPKSTFITPFTEEIENLRESISSQLITNKAKLKNSELINRFRNNQFYNLNNIKKISQMLISILRFFFKKSINLDLNRIYSPFNNLNILGKIVYLLLNKMALDRLKKILIKGAFNPYRRLTKNKKSNNLAPSLIKGIEIKVAGRLLKQRVIPKKTTKLYKKGIFNRTQIFTSYKTFLIGKNKRGAYGLNIKLNESLFNYSPFKTKSKPRKK
jgi:hypothetical protein